MSKRKRRNKSMFGPPKHKELAKIVRIDTPENARKSAKQLLNKFKRARTREQKVTIKRSVVLAANRAEAIRKKKNLSAKERREMKQIEKIYRSAAKKMKLSAILVLLLLSLVYAPVYAAGPPGSSGNDSVSVASNVPTDRITKNELYKLTYYDLYGTQIDFFSVDTYRISYSYSRNFTSYDTYYTNKLNKSVLADHGRFYFKFNASDYKSRQYFKVVYEDGYYSLFDFQFNYTVYNVFVLIDYERSGTFINLATYPATQFSVVYGSTPSWTNNGFYFNGGTVLATPATVLTQFSLYFKGVIFGRLADKNKIVFQPYSFNFQPLRSDNDADGGLGFRTEIYSSAWTGYWLNDVDAYNNGDVFAYMLDTSANNLKFGIVYADDSNRLEYSTTTAIRNTPKNVVAIGGMPSSTLYCFQGYMKQLIILANSSYDPVQLYRYYNNLSAYYTTQIYLPADTHINNTIIFTLRYPRAFMYDENKFIADTKTHGRIVKIEFNGLYLYAEIWNGTDAGDFFALHNIQYFNSINKSYILANCNYTNITVLPDFNITLYFALSYRYPFDYVAVFENETDTIYYNATLLDAVILDDTANLNLLKPDGLIFIFATGAGYGLVWFGLGQERSYQDAYIYYVTTKLNTCYTANTTIAVYQNSTLLYFGYIQQYIVLNIIVYPQVTVVLNYYDINTGLGISFNTFKTVVNGTRVYYNVLQYTLYSVLLVEAYDYFDVLISNLTAIVNSSVTFIDIGVNLTTIYIANDRDENVTVAFESNSRNYTITLPSNYIKVVNFVARRYTVYIMSRSIGVVKFNLTATVNDNIIAIKGDKIEKIDANPQVLTIASAQVQTLQQWASSGFVFGVFSTIASFIVSIVLVHLLRKRRQKIVVYKTTLF